MNQNSFKTSLSRREFMTACSLLGISSALGEYALALGNIGTGGATPNPWLSGNFAPVFDELHVTDLPVSGEIPKTLNGSYIRNGPNPVFPATPYHWFDGDGMLHSVSVASGQASYSNKFIQTEGFLRERAAGKSLYGGILAGPPYKNSANISVIRHHEKTLAAWEGGSPYEVNAPTLETIGLYNFENQWSFPFTAHPKVDPITGELLFFGYSDKKPFLRYGVLDSKGTLVHSTTLDIPEPVMMHDFAITKNYALFMDLPVVFSDKGFEFQPQLGARIGVLPKRGTTKDIRWFEIQTCWVYHVLNAYEEGNDIVFRACRLPEWPRSSACLYEWRLSLTDGQVSEKTIDKTHSEFPVVNPSLVGGPHRFGYVGRQGGDLMDGILKYDFVSGKIDSFDFGADKSGGESLYVADATRTGEDGGWLLNIIYDKVKDSSEFIVVNAQTLELTATVALPRKVPYGLHGNWI